MINRRAMIIENTIFACKNMPTKDLETESTNLVSAMKKEKNLELRSNTPDELAMHERNLSEMLTKYVCVCNLLEERK